MLESTDTLLSLAEIAAAFAGFAALVSVIRRSSEDHAEGIHDLLRLRLVISSAVAGVAGALIPVGLAGYGLRPDLVWRLSALILLIFDYGIILSFLKSYQPVKGVFPPDRLAASLVTGLEVVEQASVIVVLLGLPVANPSALYITALIANLCQAGFIFIRFVGSAFAPEEA
ncbi:MAG: hypothetical protein OEN56_08435 [Gemmatimonadota bacterium]|nr:hypothetical protein [Gemmatimonadota bacterium]